MDRRLIKPSAKRCLFGRPNDNDGFFERQKQLESAELQHFKRKWSLHSDEGEYEWTKASLDIPEVYTKPYYHKCRRRAVRPCVGKCLSFVDSDEENICGVRPPSPEAVQYCDSNTVEVDLGVFMGIVPPQPPEEQVTPKKSELGGSGDTPMSNSTNDTDHVAVSDRVCSQLLKRRRLTQKRLTDMWRIVKRRQQSLTSTKSHQRVRINRL